MDRFGSLTQTIKLVDNVGSAGYGSSEYKSLSIPTEKFLVLCATSAENNIRISIVASDTNLRQTFNFLLAGVKYHQTTDFSSLLEQASSMVKEVKQSSVVQSNTQLSQGSKILIEQNEVLQNLTPEEKYQLHTAFVEGATEGTIQEEDGMHLADIFLHAAADAGHEGALSKLQHMNQAQLQSLSTNDTKRSDSDQVSKESVLRDITKSYSKSTENSKDATKKSEENTRIANAKKVEESRVAARIKEDHLLVGRNNALAVDRNNRNNAV